MTRHRSRIRSASPSSSSSDAESSRRDETRDPRDGDPSRFSSRNVLVFFGIALLIVFVGLRVAAFRQFSKTVYSPYPILDAWYYDQVAQRVASGQWQQEEAFFMGPGYPYLLGMAYGVFGIHPATGRVVNILWSFILLLFIGRIGWRLGGTTAAIAGCAFWVLYRPALFFEQTLLMEVMAGAIGLGVVVVALEWFSLDRWRRKARPFRILVSGCFVSGLVLGIAALTRANILIFFPFLAFWIVQLLVDRTSDRETPRVSLTAEAAKPPQRKTRTNVRTWIETLPTHWKPLGLGMVALGVGSIVGVSPAMIHNLRAERDFVAITSNAGINLYIGNNDQSRGYFVVPEGWNTEQDPRGRRIAERSLQRSDLSSSEISDWWRGRALDWIRDHPAEFVRNSLRKVVLLFSGNEIAQIYHQDVMKADLAFLRWPLVTFALLFPLSAIGFANGLRSENEHHRRRGTILVLLYVVSLSLSLLPFFVTGRYRLPIVPGLCIAGGMGVAAIAELWRRKQWIRLGGIAAMGVILCSASVIAGQDRGPSATEVSQFESMHAALLMKAGKGEEAIRLLEQRSKIAPTKGIWSNLGVLYEARPDRLRDAATVYGNAAQLDPNDARIWFNLSQILLRLGKIEEGRMALERTVSLDADVQPLVWFNLAVARKLGGDPEGARKAIQEFLKRQPNDPQAIQFLASLPSEP